VSHSRKSNPFEPFTAFFLRAFAWGEFGVYGFYDKSGSLSGSKSFFVLSYRPEGPYQT